MATASLVKIRPIANDTVFFNKLIIRDECPIGSGSFGVVYKAFHSDWGCQVAYKQLLIHFISETNSFEHRLIEGLKNEAEIHRHLRHPNIVSMLGIVFERGHYGILLEFVIYGSLHNFIQRIKDLTGLKCQSIPWHLKTSMAHEISCGMSYLHTLPSPIIHGDLSIQNVLIGAQLNIKISDFGLSKWKDFTRSHTNAGTIVGTPSHVPPEKWYNPDLDADEKFDIYSFGILLWEMFTEEKAFEKIRDCMLPGLVVGGTRPPIASLPSHLPQTITDLIVICWDQQPSSRPSFAALASSFATVISEDTCKVQIQTAKARLLSMFGHPIEGNSEACPHEVKLQRVRGPLIENIRRTDRIMCVLLEKRVLTLQEYAMIQSQTTVYDVVSRLLDVISNKSLTDYHIFLESLQSTDQQHLYQLLEQTDYNLNIDHKTTLIDNYTYLTTNICLSQSTLLDKLLESYILDEREVDEIRSKKTESQKIDQLLIIILRTSSEQYQLFLDALAESGHQFVSDWIQNSSLQDVTTKLVEVRDDGQIQKSSTQCPIDAIEEDSVPEESALQDPREKQYIKNEKLKNDAKNCTNAVTITSVSHAVASCNITSTTTSDIENVRVKLLKTLHAESLVWGVTQLLDRIYSIYHESNSIVVYCATTFKRLADIRLRGRENMVAMDMVACNTNKCLYIYDDTHKCISRLGLDGDIVLDWLKLDCSRQLSVTSDGQVVLLRHKPCTVDVYSNDAVCVHTVTLPVEIQEPLHTVRTASGHFLVSHGMLKGSPHRIVELTNESRLVRCYGGPCGSGDDQLNYPAQLALDSNELVYVVDLVNNRVLVLNRTLSLCKILLDYGQSAEKPCRIHCDTVTSRLLVGLNTGRIKIYAFI